ncbi:Membrane transport protein [Aliarcobacter thereius]|uniref:Membrane transport protein n=1 Tax=Aliarcobacter thereius TaxID=544718 RepID=A0A1C0B607_9BACT|nr:transporter [Aliarcobacter thereius]OCL98595.1 Membrane transport protein [Aliarcobacter thereius]
MSLFLTLFIKIIPMYFSIVLGFFSTYFLKCDKESIAKILLYILSPLIVFNATLNVKLSLEVAFIPMFFFIFSTILSFVLLYIFTKVFKDNRANLLAFSASTGNTGNIGIPLAIIFLPNDLVDVFIFSILASILYQNSVGYYITAKGNFSAKESLKKVLRLPVLHAFLLALVLNIFGASIPDIFLSYESYLKGAYSILGVMIVGMGLEKLKGNNAFDWSFISYSMFIKFVIWPSSVLLFIFLDKNYFMFLNEGYYLLMFLFSIVPLAGNTVIVATVLNVKPEMMSITLFISILIGVVYIPFVMWLYGV